MLVGGLLVGVDDRPAEAGEVPRDRDERAPLAALVVEPAPDLVQALLGLPGDRDRDLGLSFLASLECCAVAWRVAGRGTTSARCPCGSFSDAALPNRVEARLALAPPTPPGMRVRTGRFAQHSRKRR